MIFNFLNGLELEKFEWHFSLSFVSNRHLRATPKFLLISTTSSSASRASKKEIFILNNQSSVWCYLGMLFSSKSLNNFTEFNIETKERRQNSPQNIPRASTIIKRSTIFSIYLSSKMKSTKMSFFFLGSCLNSKWFKSSFKKPDPY